MKNIIKLKFALWRGLYAIFCIGVVFTPTALAQQAVTLWFEFSYNGIAVANVQEEFTPLANNQYRLESHAKAVGLAKVLYGDVMRQSEGTFSDDGLHMQHYKLQRDSTTRQATHDKAAGVVHLQQNEEKRTETLEAGLPLLDYLTALYRPYITGEVTGGKFSVTNGWRLRVYEYTIGKSERIQTAAGEFDAIALRRDSPRGERIFWVAPELNYLPIKVYIDDKGHVFETILTDVDKS